MVRSPVFPSRLNSTRLPAALVGGRWGLSRQMPRARSRWTRCPSARGFASRKSFPRTTSAPQRIHRPSRLRKAAIRSGSRTSRLLRLKSSKHPQMARFPVSPLQWSNMSRAVLAGGQEVHMSRTATVKSRSRIWMSVFSFVSQKQSPKTMSAQARTRKPLRWSRA